jgi:hypothetical protein
MFRHAHNVEDAERYRALAWNLGEDFKPGTPENIAYERSYVLGDDLCRNTIRPFAAASRFIRECREANVPMNVIREVFDNSLRRLLTIADPDEDTDVDDFDAAADLDDADAPPPEPNPDRPLFSVDIDRMRKEMGYTNSTKKVDQSAAELYSREELLKSSVAVEAARGGRSPSTLAPQPPPPKQQQSTPRPIRTKGSEGLER